jgi:hypothetical protein
MGLKIVIPIEYQRVKKISLMAMPYTPRPSQGGGKKELLNRFLTPLQGNGANIRYLFIFSIFALFCSSIIFSVWLPFL